MEHKNIVFIVHCFMALVVVTIATMFVEYVNIVLLALCVMALVVATIALFDN